MSTKQVVPGSSFLNIQLKMYFHQVTLMLEIETFYKRRGLNVSYQKAKGKNSNRNKLSYNHHSLQHSQCVCLLLHINHVIKRNNLRQFLVSF